MIVFYTGMKVMLHVKTGAERKWPCFMWTALHLRLPRLKLDLNMITSSSGPDVLLWQESTLSFPLMGDTSISSFGITPPPPSSAPPLPTKRLSAKEDYSPALFSSRLVKPMVAHLAGRLRLDGGRGPVYPTAALVLKV